MKSFFKAPLPADSVERLLKTKLADRLPAARVRQLLGVPEPVPVPVVEPAPAAAVTPRARARRLSPSQWKDRLEAVAVGSSIRVVDAVERALWLHQAREHGLILESQKQQGGGYLITRRASVTEVKKWRRIRGGKGRKGRRG